MRRAVVDVRDQLEHRQHDAQQQEAHHQRHDHDQAAARSDSSSPASPPAIRLRKCPPCSTSAPGTSPVSSPIFTRSTINCGKIFELRQRLRQRFAIRHRLARLRDRLLHQQFGITCSVIFNAVNTGTPFCSSVANTRANCPNRLSRTTLPIDRRLHFPLVNFAARLLRSQRNCRTKSRSQPPPSTKPMIAPDVRHRMAEHHQHARGQRQRDVEAVETSP